MEKILIREIEKRLLELDAFMPPYCGRDGEQTVKSKRVSFDGLTDSGFSGKEKWTFIKSPTACWVSVQRDGIYTDNREDFQSLNTFLNGLYSDKLTFHTIWT